MENLKEMGLTELDDKSLKEADGGFIVLTILGVTYTATQVATAVLGAAAAGVAAGVAVAVATD